MTEREKIECDLLVVGAGPAGLAAALTAKLHRPETSVVVIEKGAEIGSHVLSGAVMDPAGLDALIPGWRQQNPPAMTEVTEDRFAILTASASLPLPGWALPPTMGNHGNLIVSLGELCRWLADRAQSLGVDIFSGFAGSELLYGPKGEVVGIATGDTGRQRDGSPSSSFAPGIELRSSYVLLAEGTRGSLSEEAIRRFNLRADRQPPKYGLGIKELWELAPERHHSGLVQHTVGWPLGKEGGGSFIYHFAQSRAAVGFVVHLDYRNPHLSPFEEMQRFKTHPKIAPMFENARRIAYGARTISEGGWQSVPKLAFPGGALIGCSAGFVNLPRIKGIHNAMRSGILAGDSVASALASGRSRDVLAELEQGWRASPLGQELRQVRNTKPLWSRFGGVPGAMVAGVDLWATTLLRGWSPFGTLPHLGPDHAATEVASNARPIVYPRPDGKLTFDRLSSVHLSSTQHREGQPVHLKVLDPALQRSSELELYGGPSTRYCPAGVYEWVMDGDGAPSFVVNAANCVHCKTCDIKDPNQNIRWTAPEGGGGPLYSDM